MRWPLRIAVALLVGVLLFVGGVYLLSTVRLSATHEAQVVPVEIPDDAAAVARGQHLLTLSKCGECHGEDLGGKVIIDAPLLARIAGPNLTPGGPVGTRSDLELVQAIRYGLATDGSALLGMPTAEHFYFSDAELGAMIAAIRALEPVQRTVPSQRVGLGFRALYLADQIELVGAEEIDINAPRPEAVPPSVSLAYGEHLARTGGCYSCHGEHLAGGPMAGAPPDFPPASNLTPHAAGLSSWSAADFTAAMREGIRPDGSTIDPAMPWRYTQAMTDDEVAALWMFLQTVPPMPGEG